MIEEAVIEEAAIEEAVGEGGGDHGEWPDIIDAL